MAEANNPHVVNLLEFNEDDGIPYLVLEFVAGTNLGQLLEERARLNYLKHFRSWLEWPVV